MFDNAKTLIILVNGEVETHYVYMLTDEALISMLNNQYGDGNYEIISYE